MEPATFFVVLQLVLTVVVVWSPALFLLGLVVRATLLYVAVRMLEQRDPEFVERTARIMVLSMAIEGTSWVADHMVLWYMHMCMDAICCLVYLAIVISRALRGPPTRRGPTQTMWSLCNCCGDSEQVMIVHG